MSTLVVSDLHLGALTNGDVARRPQLRAPLLDAIAAADELVLLGDVLELRDGPLASALEASRGFFEDVGAVLGDRRVMIVPGNHDYPLIAPWLEVRRSRDGRMGLAERVSPADASPAAAQIAAWLGRAPLELAYPGLWLRPDVYATHGHYVDLHISVPSFERVAARVVERVVRRGDGELRSPADYEATLSPVYALLDEIAQVAPERGSGGSGASERAWRVLMGDGRRQRLPRPAQAAAWGAWLLAVAALRRAGLGPLSADLSGAAVRRAGVVAMGEVIARLGIDAEHVIFGHTHRAGPFPDRDDAAEWRTGDGVHLINSGCWLYSPAFLTGSPNESPYWPGPCVWVDDEGPPRLDRLLRYQAHADLWPA